MASGVKVADACKEEYQNLKMGRKYRYILFGLSDDLKEIVVKKLAEPEATYDEFVSDLEAARDAKECRYAIYSAKYSKGDVPRGKIMFLMWTPSESTVKQKMVYASSVLAFKRELGAGIGLSFNAGADDEIQWDEVLKRLQDGDKYY